MPLCRDRRQALKHEWFTDTALDARDAQLQEIAVAAVAAAQSEAEVESDEAEEISDADGFDDSYVSDGQVEPILGLTVGNLGASIVNEVAEGDEAAAEAEAAQEKAADKELSALAQTLAQQLGAHVGLSDDKRSNEIRAKIEEKVRGRTPRHAHRRQHPHLPGPARPRPPAHSPTLAPTRASIGFDLLLLPASPTLCRQVHSALQSATQGAADAPAARVRIARRLSVNVESAIAAGALANIDPSTADVEHSGSDDEGGALRCCRRSHPLVAAER